MTDHTPTTEEVRDDFAVECDQAGNLLRSEDRAKLFDRWRVAHERKIAAEALREAAKGLPFPQDPYGGFDHESLRASQVQHGHWLRDRADHIEQGPGE